ncbi:UNVERIFIED_ORG: S-DNA-T family DNA segregation ATPase FtsK/SpoIIIE [Heyndrickxia coagulans]
MRLLQTFLLRSKLLNCFRTAGIYLSFKSGDKTVYVYPKIHSIKYKPNEAKTEIVFTLKNGIDPKEIDKKEYVFKQYFGKNIELDGDLKKYVLNIFHQQMPNELKYDYAKIKDVIAPYKLPIICGMNRNGQYVAFDLLKQPHILIAGETGSGKSTQLRSILTTLIKSKKPDELQLYLADCKKSEFHIFRRVEHVQCVLSQSKDIQKMLAHIKKELDERSNLTETFEVGHVDDLPQEHKRPYIVVCIDEFVMLRKNEMIMEILTEIVAIGRTLGVFAILSMQRPNSQVLDTTIRANLTVSMGFKLRDKTEARIVNTPNAEKIEQSGRFIMNANKIYELQAPFLGLDKAKELLNAHCVNNKNIKEINEHLDKDVNGYANKENSDDEGVNEIANIENLEDNIFM